MKTPWLDLMRGEIGVTETPGPRATKRILEYFAAAGSPQIVSDETAWCSAFMCWGFESVNIASPKNLMARSWRRWGKPSKCVVGAVAVLPRGSDQRFGHVTLVDEVLPGGYFMGLGGNQKNGVRRTKYKVADVIDFRWPTTSWTSGTIRAALGAGFGGGTAILPEIYTLASDYVSGRQEVDPTSAVATIGGVIVLALGLWLIVSRRLGKMKAPEETDDDV